MGIEIAIAMETSLVCDAASLPNGLRGPICPTSCRRLDCPTASSAMAVGHDVYGLHAKGSSSPADVVGHRGSLAETMATIVAAARDAVIVRQEGRGPNAALSRVGACRPTIS